MKFFAFFLMIFSISVSAKEYAGIDICSKFDFQKFSDDLRELHGIKDIRGKSNGSDASYEFVPYKIMGKDYSVVVKVAESYVYQVEISPFLTESSSLKGSLVKKYGYSGRRVVEKLIGDHKIEKSYLKLNDPEVRLYTDKIIFGNGSVLRSESVTYECVAIAEKLAEKSKKLENEQEKKRPKMNF